MMLLSDTWCFKCFVVGHLRNWMFKNTSRGEKERETRMHAGVHCIASERSWQTALVSLVFLFFLSSWLRKKSRSPCWVGDGCAGAAALRFLPALQSHPGRGIVKRPAVPRPLAMVSCKYLILLSLSYISISLSPSCGCFLDHFLFFSLLIFCFHFDLQEGHTTFLSVQAGFLYCFSNKRRRGEQSSRKGSSLCIQNHDQLFFVIPAEYEKSQRKVYTETLRMYSSP